MRHALKVLFVVLLPFLAGCTLDPFSPSVHTNDFCPDGPEEIPFTCNGVLFRVTVCSTDYDIRECRPGETEPHVLIFNGWVIVETVQLQDPPPETPDSGSSGTSGNVATGPGFPSTGPREPNRTPWRILLVRVRPGVDVYYAAPVSGEPDLTLWVEGKHMRDSSKELPRGRALAYIHREGASNDWYDVRAKVPPLTGQIDPKKIDKFADEVRKEIRSAPKSQDK